MDISSFPHPLLILLEKSLIEELNRLAEVGEKIVLFHESAAELLLVQEAISKHQSCPTGAGAASSPPSPGVTSAPLRSTAKRTLNPRGYGPKLSAEERIELVHRELKKAFQLDSQSDLNSKLFAQRVGLDYAWIKAALPRLEAAGWLSRESTGKRGVQSITLRSKRGARKPIAECYIRGDVMTTVRQLILDALLPGTYAELDLGAIQEKYPKGSAGTFENVLNILLHEGSVLRGREDATGRYVFMSKMNGR